MLIHVSIQMDEQERRTVIMAEIDRQPGISKTDLANRLSGKIARNTVFHMLNELVNEQEIIARKYGKRIRYSSVEATEADARKSLAVTIDAYVKDLSAIRKDLLTYPYDLLTRLDHRLINGKADVMTLKKTILDELESEYAVDDVMRDYNESHDKIRILLTKTRVSEDISNRTKKYLCAAYQCMYAVVSGQHSLKNQRKNYGKGEKRNSLSEKIKQFAQIEEKLFSHTHKILINAEDIQRYMSDETPWWDQHQLVYYIQGVERSRGSFKKTVEETLDRMNKIRTHEHVSDEVELMFQKTLNRLENMKAELLETQEDLDQLYKAALTNQAERELHSAIVSAEKYLDAVRKK